MKLSLRKTTFIALLAAFSLITYFIESLLPPLIPAISGARLGISNIFILYALYAFGWPSALMVAVIKSLLGPLLAGAPTAMFFSLSGTALSLVTMTVLKNVFKGRFGLPGISVAGALMHNAGQMIMAMIFTSSPFIAAYFPALAMIAVPCGIITGVAADRLLKATHNIALKQNNRKIGGTHK